MTDPQTPTGIEALLREADDFHAGYGRAYPLPGQLAAALRAEATRAEQAEQERDNLAEANRIMLDRANRTEEAEAAQQQAEEDRDKWKWAWETSGQAALKAITELREERDAQYDQAVEATQRALLAEQELNDFKEEKRNEI